ncbi:hypothetical protein GAYE_SCF66G6870 [Galdieria yellowstonensis]|uniref:t-SNARE coiled-coil homology domain-containing protein n=1 Tax=Galdieria yellowstonensis TaxID=3028027 RepID=A0AAV9INA8_9RHOD|nr:hypothetical protein GAYE_SCF66G6870 [Galdieria yellowstonensis]
MDRPVARMSTQDRKDVIESGLKASDTNQENVWNQLSSVISKIASYNQNIRLLLKRASNSPPSTRKTLLQQLETLKQQCLDNVVLAEELLKKVSNTSDSLERLRLQKVSEDLQSTIATFHSLLEDLKRVENDQIPSSQSSLFPVIAKVSHPVVETSEVPSSSSSNEVLQGESTNLLAQQQLQQQKNISYDSTTTDFLRERQDAIREIETSISEVNSIFKDLAIMIEEQGFQVEELGSNIENTVVQTELAVDQLTKAKARRSRRRRRLLICLLFFFLLLFMFFLVAVS